MRKNYANALRSLAGGHTGGPLNKWALAQETNLRAGQQQQQLVGRRKSKEGLKWKTYRDKEEGEK